jgi:hypothetical protein
MTKEQTIKTSKLPKHAVCAAFQLAGVEEVLGNHDVAERLINTWGLDVARVKQFAAALLRDIDEAEIGKAAAMLRPQIEAMALAQADHDALEA